MGFFLAKNWAKLTECTSPIPAFPDNTSSPNLQAKATSFTVFWILRNKSEIN